MSAQIGIIGGSGLYDMAELTDREEVTARHAVRRPVGPVRARRRCAAGGWRSWRGTAPGTGSCRRELNFRANIFGFKTARRRAHPLGERRRQPQRGVPAAATSSCPTSSSTGRRAASARSSAAGSWRTSASRTRCAATCRRVAHESAAAVGRARSHLGGTYVCMEGPQFSTLAESKALPVVGHGRHRHDEPAGGQARARGGDLLRDARAGDRLRLLAPRPRLGDRRDDHRAT